MELLVRAFPVLPGKEPEMQRFARELETTRAAEAAAFYQRLGIAYESWHAQAHGDSLWVIAVTQFSGRQMADAAKDYASSSHEFDRWFREQVLLVTGVNPETTPLGPPTTRIFDTALPSEERDRP